MSARVAVVDDNRSTRYATARVLKAAGYDVVEAATGSEALERIDGSVELAVLDVNLPDIDGFEVCRRLRSAPVTAQLPVIFLSATFLDTGDQVHGLNTGADAYLTHPIEPAVLVASVGALLRARRAEAIQRTADAKLRAVFNHVPVGIVILDAAGRVQEANPVFCELQGVPADTLTGRHGGELFGDWQGWKDIGAHSRPQRLPLRRDDGTVKHVEWHVAHENLAGVRVVAALDVTEREELLTSERAARAEAEKATRLKDEFLAVLSHELRNPLSTILGWTEVLVRRPHQDLERGLQAIQRGALLQKQLVSDLLDMSAMLQGKMHLDFADISPQGPVESAIEVVQASAAAKGVRLDYQPPAQAPDVRADPLRLQQIMWNLLSNAIKFTPAGGTVTVRLERLDHHLLITVQDSGRGIDQEFLPQIFNRFQQAEAGPDRRAPGLGLGLAIVKQLVELHSGTVEAYSAGPGTGARFSVSLPVANTAASLAVTEAVAGLEGIRVLVVDDDDDHRGWLARLVTQAGGTAQEAANANAALAAVEEAPPDVLISDIGMPGKDGYALMRELRERGHSAGRLPAISLTAYARREDQEAALAAGFQQHIRKPPSPQQLIEAVARLAAQRPAPGPA